MMNLDVAIFIVSAVVAVFGATMVIAQRNPIASVLYLILSLIAQAVCYVQLGGLFMGAILIIVYAGAIMVLFLFVIMLLNLRGSDDLGGSSGPIGRFTRIIFGVLLTLELASLIKVVPLRDAATGIMGAPPSDFGSVRTVATLMFTDYVYAFELTGVLLLAAVVGAVVVARTDKSERPQSGADTTPMDKSDSPGDV
jgi:NADH-quinone oxidoreductase subunit J